MPNKSVAEITAETMHNYLLMGHILQCHVSRRPHVVMIRLKKSRRSRGVDADATATLCRSSPPTSFTRTSGSEPTGNGVESPRLDWRGPNSARYALAFNPLPFLSSTANALTRHCYLRLARRLDAGPNGRAEEQDPEQARQQGKGEEGQVEGCWNRLRVRGIRESTTSCLVVIPCQLRSEADYPYFASQPANRPPRARLPCSLFRPSSYPLASFFVSAFRSHLVNPSLPRPRFPPAGTVG
jgi:hypothetical protein